MFWEDLYTPKGGMDSWNPRATHDSLKLFLGCCARDDMNIIKVDYVLAYVQTKMRECALVMLPEGLKQILPKDTWKWIGIPLLLLKVLHGCTYSGRLLYDKQAGFLFEQGFQQTQAIAIWQKCFPCGSCIHVLQYSDDLLIGSRDVEKTSKFVTALSNRFSVEVHPHADWYLQTQIQRDRDGNYILDQQHYSKSIVR